MRLSQMIPGVASKKRLDKLRVDQLKIIARGLNLTEINDMKKSDLVKQIYEQREAAQPLLRRQWLRDNALPILLTVFCFLLAGGIIAFRDSGASTAICLLVASLATLLLSALSFYSPGPVPDRVWSIGGFFLGALSVIIAILK